MINLIEKEIDYYWMPRSGGTFVWQVLSRIFTSVATTHGQEWLTTTKPLIIVYRDFRDVALSHWRIVNAQYDDDGNITNTPTRKELDTAIKRTKTNSKILYHYKIENNNNPNVLWLSYEKFFNNYDYLFKQIEEFFDIKIPEENKKIIKEETTIKKNKEIAKNVPLDGDKEDEFDNYDISSKIHVKHIYTGQPNGWMNIVPKELHQYMNDVFSGLLEDWGYKMIPVYYGQHGEEDLIDIYLGPNAKKTNGKYIDIGAGDPKIHSNTYYYYLKGWNGILVEPNPNYAESIKKERPRDIHLPIAITDYYGQVEMCSSTTVGSFVGDRNKKRKIEGGRGKKFLFTVDCMPIDTLIKRYPEYKEPDFLNMDIESMEERVLSRCDFRVFKPKVIIIEYKCPGINEEGEEEERMDYRWKWEHYLLPFYTLHKLHWGGNAFYVRKGDV